MFDVSVSIKTLLRMGKPFNEGYDGYRNYSRIGDPITV